MSRKTYRKVITSPELIEKINPENQKLVERFLRNFSTKRSGASVITYTSNYNIFFVWNLLHNDNKFFINIKKTELMDFFDYGSETLKWSPNRYAQMWSSLSSLSNFIENILDEKYPDFRNLVKKIEKLPKANVRKKSIFSKEELDRLADWLLSKNRIQEVCLLKLMMASGARASELVRFTTELVDLNNLAFDDLFLETTEEMKVKGRGKNGKMIYRYILKDMFEESYLQWLPIREEIMKANNQNHTAIFIKRNGEPATTYTIRGWMEKWEKFLEKDWYPHAMRHFNTTYLLSIGLEQEFVQDLQKWSDGMVKIYNDQTAKDRKWKGLAKLKAHIEAEKSNVSSDNIIVEELDEKEI